MQATIITITTTAILSVWCGAAFNALRQFLNTGAVLKKRFDLIPDILKTEKGNQAKSSERATTTKNAATAGGVEQSFETERQRSGTLSSYFSVLRTVPALKTGNSFLFL